MVNKSINRTFNNVCKQYCYSIPVYVVIVSLILILLVDAIGNTIVVTIIIVRRKMQTFTNWLILNMAFADIFVALTCITLEVPLEIRNKWIYGKFFCSIFYPIQSATVYGSVFTLVVLSCSRYWAIIHPFRRQPNRFEAKLSICVIWVMSFLLVTPYMITLEYDEKREVCIETWSETQGHIFTIATFALQYILPLTIIIVAYVFIVYDIALKKTSITSCYEDKGKYRENQKIIKLLLIITINFALSVLPYHVVQLSVEFGNGGYFKYIADVSIASYLLLYLHSAVNPLIYITFSSSFREGFAESYTKGRIYLCSYQLNSSHHIRKKSHRSSTTVTFCQQTRQISILSSEGKDVFLDSSKQI